MQSPTYATRREQLTTYFDQTAAAAWEALTSDAPVSRIRQTVRAGRDDMRNHLLASLPQDLSGQRVLDAGCGTGALAIEAARRGADVCAIDVAENLVAVARERCPEDLGGGSVRFEVGDMCAPELGEFDHVVAMDSLIHYDADDIVDVLSGLCRRTRHSVLFTFAPRTPALSAMHLVGRLIPSDAHRAPAIVPVSHQQLKRQLVRELFSFGWQPVGSHRVSSAFYKSHAMELRRE